MGGLLVGLERVPEDRDRHRERTVRCLSKVNKTLRKLLIIWSSCVALALAAGAPGPALADPPSDRARAEEMAREAIEQLLRALELMIESIPQYELPEVNEDGDIIIRRKRRREREAPGEPEVEETTI